MFFCPKCGEGMYSSSRDPEGWGVCPKCQYCCFNITAKLEARNSTVKEVLRKVEEEDASLPTFCPKSLLEEINTAEYSRNLIGDLGGWTYAQYENIEKDLDKDNTRQYRTPPLLCVNKHYIQEVEKSIWSVSSPKPNNREVTGINVPIFQEQCQFVGHCALYRQYPGENSRFTWRTYLHKFYINRPRAFLSYRPEPVPNSAELIIVDNFMVYLRLLHWYDTGAVDTNTFYRPVIPMMILGLTNPAVHFLSKYFWQPQRLTLLTTNQDLRKDMWAMLNGSEYFLCPEFRIMAEPESTWRVIHDCTHREEFENIIENQTKMFFIKDLC